MNYSKIIKNDFTAGEGICVSLFVSGCAIHCPGCHNPEAWDEDFGTPFTKSTVNEILEAIEANGIQRNLCLMGGDPFYSGNDLVLVRLINVVKEKYPNIKIYAWTGYTYEYLINSPRPTYSALLERVDYLIDGPYIQEQRDITLKMRGSRNQRILHLKDGKIVN